MIPEDHVIDEKILFGILDKDRDGVFSFDDFVMNFPKYDTTEVETFMQFEKKKASMPKKITSGEDSDPFGSEGSVGLSSLDSE